MCVIANDILHHLPGRLVITGATGFIGSRMALLAQAAGLHIAATGRAVTPVELAHMHDLQVGDLRVTPGDLRDPTFVQSLLKPGDTVIHLAAAQHEAHQPDDYFHSVNVAGTCQLLTAGKQVGIRRFVYGSTIGVYGDRSGVLDESSPTQPDNIYARTKLEAEERVRAYSDAFETCVVRISETYGAGDLRLLKLFNAVDRGHFAMMGSGNNRRQLIHVNDLAWGLLNAAHHPAAVRQTFVFAGHEVITTNDMVATIARVLGREPPKLKLPLWPFVAAATVLETSLRPLRIQAPLHRRRLDFFRKSFTFSTTRAMQALGFRAETDFRAGAADAAMWYRARGYLRRTLHGAVADANSA